MKKRKMVTNTRVLKRRLAALVLSTALVAFPTAFAGDTEDEEEINSSRFTLGNDWERESVVSYGFSDRSSHVSSANSDHHSDWDSASHSQWSSSRPRNSRSQKLTDIVDLRRHIFKGNLEITPANFKGLLQFAKIHETAFNTYDKGVFVKEWKASLGFKSLLDLLVKFNQPRTFKVTVNWDQEADASEVIARAVQFYEELTTLDIANCKLTDAGMQDIMESVAYPEKLKELNVIGNSINDVTLKSLQSHFPNLTSFKAGADIIPPRISPQPLSTQGQVLVEEPQSSTKRPRTQATILIEEDGIPEVLLRKATAEKGHIDAQSKLGNIHILSYGGREGSST